MKRKENGLYKAYMENLKRQGIEPYKYIGKVRKAFGYSLLAYGIATCWLPSGSQLALIGGCLLLNIPFNTVYNQIKYYMNKAINVLKVLCSKRRIKYELKLIKLRCTR